MVKIIAAIKPEYIEKIINGEKTIEIRKTLPNTPHPFKVLMYCTKDKFVKFFTDFDGEFLNGKIVGEFICDAHGHFEPTSNGYIYHGRDGKFGVEDDFIIRYMNGKMAYGWHISETKVYDAPIELSDMGMKKAPQSWCYIKEGRMQTKA